MHWTYDNVPEVDSDLMQGDLIGRSRELLEVFADVHPYFGDSKYSGFMVLSQSCDLVRRKAQCKTPYITLGVTRPLESVLPGLLDVVCEPVGDDLYFQDTKWRARELLGRIFQQTEQALGVFYLHPDLDVNVAEPTVALLRVAVALREQHYEVLCKARTARLAPEFQSKLGWLVGNLYSRVGTRDWDKRSLDKMVDAQLEAQSIAWLDRETVDAAKEGGMNCEDMSSTDIGRLAAYQPSEPRTQIVQSAVSVLRSIAPHLTNADVQKFENRFSQEPQLKIALKRAAKKNKS